MEPVVIVGELSSSSPFFTLDDVDILSKTRAQEVG